MCKNTFNIISIFKNSQIIFFIIWFVTAMTLAFIIENSSIYLYDFSRCASTRLRRIDAFFRKNIIENKGIFQI